MNKSDIRVKDDLSQKLGKFKKVSKNYDKDPVTLM